VHRSGAGAFVKGRFGAELSALIKARLEPLARPCGPDDTRDHAERLADALQTYLSGGDSRWDPILIIDLQQPARRQSSPHPATAPGRVADSGDRRDPTASSGASNGSDPEWTPEPPTPGWPFDGTPFTARLADGTPITTQRAREILLNAGFSALVLGSDGLPIYLGRRVRCATPAQRRVLLTRYTTCVVQGCEIPATGCQVDHVDGWENGQPSDIDRLVLCCAWHNRYKWRHPDRVIITRHADGRYRYQITRPVSRLPGRQGVRSTDQRSSGRDP
jgi:hypothetical protein